MNKKIKNKNLKFALEKLKFSIQNAEAFGVYDREPTWIIKSLIRQKLHSDEDIKIPVTAKNWSLYSQMFGSEEVARILYESTKDLLHAIDRAKFKDIKLLKKWIEENL